MLALLSAPITQPVQAQSCTPDPFGGETCLPDPDPDDSGNPGNSSGSSGSDNSDRPRIPIWGGIPGVPAGVIRQAADKLAELESGERPVPAHTEAPTQADMFGA